MCNGKNCAGGGSFLQNQCPLENQCPVIKGCSFEMPNGYTGDYHSEVNFHACVLNIDDSSGQFRLEDGCIYMAGAEMDNDGKVKGNLTFGECFYQDIDSKLHRKICPVLKDCPLVKK